MRQRSFQPVIMLMLVLWPSDTHVRLARQDQFHGPQIRRPQPDICSGTLQVFLWPDDDLVSGRQQCGAHMLSLYIFLRHITKICVCARTDTHTHAHAQAYHVHIILMQSIHVEPASAFERLVTKIKDEGVLSTLSILARSEFGFLSAHCACVRHWLDRD